MSYLLPAVMFNYLPDSVVGWISSFLTNRMQRVRVDTFSNWTHILSGVTQGSVLGPVLFCLALNELSPVCKNSLNIKYADDIIILHLVQHVHDDNLQSEWNNILSWSRVS